MSFTSFFYNWWQNSTPTSFSTPCGKKIRPPTSSLDPPPTNNLDPTSILTIRSLIIRLYLIIYKALPSAWAFQKRSQWNKTAGFEMKLKRGKIIRWRSRLLVEVYSWSENKKNQRGQTDQRVETTKSEGAWNDITR